MQIVPSTKRRKRKHLFGSNTSTIYNI